MKINREQVWDEGVDLVDDLVDAGADEDAALDAVAEFLDAVIPLDELIPGPAGHIAEKLDGPAIRKGLDGIKALLSKLVKVDPDKRAARKHRKRMKREKRKAAKAARRAD